MIFFPVYGNFTHTHNCDDLAFVILKYFMHAKEFDTVVPNKHHNVCRHTVGWWSKVVFQDKKPTFISR